MRSKSVSIIVSGFFAAILSVGFVLSVPASSVAAKSAAQCESYARDYADHHSTLGKGVVGGAVGGAGRIVGGITGQKGSVTNDWRSVYDRAYSRCMSEK